MLDEELRRHQCYERVDTVSLGATTTLLKKMARLRQAKWRELHQLPIGTQPIRPNAGQTTRLLGSRIDLTFTRRTGANLLTDRVREAVECNMPYPRGQLPG
jgi:hypothetical protein